MSWYNIIDDNFKSKIDKVYSDEYKLLGDYDFTEDEIEVLKKYVDACLKERPFDEIGETKFFDKVMILVIVHELKQMNKEYSDNKFWDKVCLIFDPDEKNIYYGGKLISDIVGTKLYDRYEAVFKLHKRVLFKSKNNKRMFEQTLLFQSYSPRTSIIAFIKLAWMIYIDENLLDSDYSESDIEFCEKIISTCNSKFGDDDSDINIDFGGTQYDIRAGLRYGFKQNKQKCVYLLDRIFNYIYHSDNNDDILDNYLGILVSKQVEQLKKIEDKSNSKRRKFERIKGKAIHTIVEYIPQYRFNNNIDNPVVCISFPKLILLDDINKFKTSTYIIEVGGVQIKTYCAYFKYNESMTILNEIDIRIDDILSECNDNFEISVKVFFDNLLIKKIDLSRKYILFKANEERKGNTAPKGEYFVYIPKDINVRSILHLQEWQCYSILNNFFCFSANDGDCLIINDNKINFGIVRNSSFVLDKIPKCIDSICFNNGVEDILFYTSIPNMIITIEDNNISNNYRILHECICKSGENIIEEFKVNELEQEGNRFILSNSNFNSTKIGYHKLMLIHYLSNQNVIIEKQEYFYDKNFKKDSINGVVYDNNNFDLLFELFDDEYSASSLQGEINKYLIDGFKGEFKFSFPYVKWKFGSTNETIFFRNPIKVKPIFIKDIIHTETLDFDTNVIIEKLLWKDDNEMIFDFNCERKENSFVIGPKLKELDCTGTLFFKLKNDEQEYELFKFTNNIFVNEEEILDGFELDDNGKLIFNLVNGFKHDSSKYLVNIILKSNTKKYIYENINPDEIYTCNDEFIDDVYSINIEWKEVKLFSKYLKYNFEEYEPKILIGNEIKVEFNDVESILLKKVRIDCDNQQKIKGISIYDLHFNKYDEDENLEYYGVTRIDSKKTFVKFNLFKNRIKNFKTKDNQKIYYDSKSKILSLKETNNIILNSVYIDK